MLNELKNHIYNALPSLAIQTAEVAVGSGVGSLLTLSDPRGVAIGLAAQKIFNKPSVPLLAKTLGISPEKPMTAKKLNYLRAGLLTTWIGSLFAGRKVAQLTGYPTSLKAMIGGQTVLWGGLIATAIAAHILFPDTEENPTSSEAVVEITEDNFEKEVEQSKTPVILDFYTPLCAPCKLVAPIFSDLGEELKGQVKLGKVNAEKDRALAQKLGVFSYPTFLFMKEGRVVYQRGGMLDREGFLKNIEEHFGS